MFKLLEYYGRFQGVRGDLTGLPAWGRLLLFVAALPGALLIGLSITALLVSILALLLLTVPLYRLLKAVTSGREGGRPAARASRGAVETVVVADDGSETIVEDVSPRAGRRQIDVKIID